MPLPGGCEFASEPAAGAVEPDPHCVAGAAKHGADLVWIQAFPRHQSEQLLIRIRQAPERGSGVGSLAVVPARYIAPS